MAEVVDTEELFIDLLVASIEDLGTPNRRFPIGAARPIARKLIEDALIVPSERAKYMMSTRRRQQAKEHTA